MSLNGDKKSLKDDSNHFRIKLPIMPKRTRMDDYFQCQHAVGSLKLNSELKLL